MKLYKRAVIASSVILFMAVGLVVSGGLPAQAKSAFLAGDNVSQLEPLDGALFGAGDTVRVVSDVNGDVFVAGQSVTISGDINGDVIVAGQNVTISGVVDGDVRVFAQSLTITSEIKGSLTSAVQNLTIANTAKIARDASFAGQLATIDGQIGRDLNAAVEELYLSGSVVRDIVYVSDRELQRSADASVGGSVELITPSRPNAIDKSKSDNVAHLVFSTYNLLAILLGVILFSLIFGRWIRSAEKHAQPRPWGALLAGFVVAAAVPVVSVMLTLTIIGIPVALALILAHIVLSFVGVVFLSHYIGGLVMKDKGHILVRGGVGAVIYSLILSIPLIGIIAWMVGSLIGNGIVVKDIYQRLQAKPAVKLAAKKAPSKPSRA